MFEDEIMLKSRPTQLLPNKINIYLHSFRQFFTNTRMNIDKTCLRFSLSMNLNISNLKSAYSKLFVTINIFARVNFKTFKTNRFVNFERTILKRWKV